MDELQLLVVADDPLVRAGLALLLADLPGCQIIGQVRSDGWVDALEDPTDLISSFGRADVIIWDLGWETPATLPDWPGTIPVIALLPDGDVAAEVWAAGVRGLLPRDLGAGKLLAAAQATAHGLVVIDPSLAPNLLTTTGPTAEALPVEELTPRESEVLQLLTEGLTNKAIAQRLNISDHTVKFHVNAILSKLNAQSRTEAVVRATRLGLILL